MNLDRITIMPDLCGGEPTIRGMRITVSHVLEMLAGGMKPEEILQDFPYLEQADIDACLEYAARHARDAVDQLDKVLERIFETPEVEISTWASDLGHAYSVILYEPLEYPTSSN